MRRDDRPYFDDELGIPWDEYQLACVVSCDLGIKQGTWRLLDKNFPMSIYDDWIDEWAEKIARRASSKLRNHPSHRLGQR